MAKKGGISVYNLQVLPIGSEESHYNENLHLNGVTSVHAPKYGHEARQLALLVYSDQKRCQRSGKTQITYVLVGAGNNIKLALLK